MKKGFKLLISIILAFIVIGLIMTSKSIAEEKTTIKGQLKAVNPYFNSSAGFTLYCRQAADNTAMFDTTLYKGNSGSLSNGLAWALHTASDDMVRQYLIWRSNYNEGDKDWTNVKRHIADHVRWKKWPRTTEDICTDGANKWDAIKTYEDYVNADNHSISFASDPEPKTGKQDGKFKLGPFKLDYQSNDWQSISNYWLETDTGATIGKEKLTIEGSMAPNNEFYVIFNKDDAKGVKTVKLSVNLHYKLYSGTYTEWNSSYVNVQGADPYHPEYCKGYSQQDQISISTGETGHDVVATSIELKLTIDLKGYVFKDMPQGKKNTENGYMNADPDSHNIDPDKFIPNIKVTMHTIDENGNEIASESKLTDQNGHFEWLDQWATNTYWFEYEYNGMYYEPTTWKCTGAPSRKQQSVGWDDYNDTNNDRMDSAHRKDNSQNRANFNNKFTPVGEGANGQTKKVPQYYQNGEAPKEEQIYIPAYTPEFNITARAVWMDDSHNTKNTAIYGIDNSDDELHYINLGLKDREKFDLMLRKYLMTVDLKINGQQQTYDYDEAILGDQNLLNVKESDADYALKRGLDYAPYNRTLKESDVAYNEHTLNVLGKAAIEMKVTYKIVVKNQTLGDLTGYVETLNDFHDSAYSYESSYVMTADGNTQTINWQETGQSYTVNANGQSKTYQKMKTHDLQSLPLSTTLGNQGGFSPKYEIWVTYKVDPKILTRDNIKENKSETFTGYNYSEIGGYRTEYSNTINDKNGIAIHNKGDNAGLIDIDSTPDSQDSPRNIVNQEMQDYVDRVQNSNGAEFNSDENKKYFEDDADAAPGLKIILQTGNPRTIKGNVYEDSPLKSKLQANERVGDGINGDADNDIGENPLKQVRVEIRSKGTELNDGTWVDKRTDEPDYSDGSSETTDNSDDLNNFLATAGSETFSNNGQTDPTNPNNMRFARTDSDGNYQFTGYVPGNYILLFYYGDEVMLETDQIRQSEDSRILYTGQDYKSTLYGQNGRQSLYNDPFWYDPKKDGDTHYNDASDNLKRRDQVNQYSQDLVYDNATELNKTIADRGNLNKLAENTKMNSLTAPMTMSIEFVDGSPKRDAIDTNYNETQGGEESQEYVTDNVDFGIIERPQSNISFEKRLAGLKIVTAGDGQTIFDSSYKPFGADVPPKVTNLTWKRNNEGWERTSSTTSAQYVYDRGTRGLVNATIDTNLLHGATLTLTFKMKIKNIGETDYTDFWNYEDSNIWEQNCYYVTGEEPADKDANIATYSPILVLDYVSNNLSYDSRFNENTNADGDTSLADTIGWYSKQEDLDGKSDVLNKIFSATASASDSYVHPIRIAADGTLLKDSSGDAVLDNLAKMSSLQNYAIAGISGSNYANSSGNDHLKPAGSSMADSSKVYDVLKGRSNNLTKSNNADLAPQKTVESKGLSTAYETPEAPIVLTKVLSDTDFEQAEGSKFENITEVLNSYTTNGRRTYGAIAKDGQETDLRKRSIPGNYSNGKATITTTTGNKTIDYNEPDTAESETISITPPFGARDIIKYALLAMGILAVLGIGIFFIRKSLVSSGKSLKENGKK